MKQILHSLQGTDEIAITEGGKNVRVLLSVRLTNWLTSGFYFALTFIIYHYLGHLMTSLFAAKLGYRPVFSYAGMDTLKSTTGWTVARIAFVYVLPCLLTLIAGVISFFVYRSVRVSKLHLRTFLFWMAFNGFLYYFSHIIVGLLSGFQFNSTFFNSFVSLYAWMEMSSSKSIILLFIQALLSLPLVFFLIRPIHELSYSNRLMVSRKAWLKWKELLALPLLIGSVIVVIASFPMDMKYATVRVMSAFGLSVFMILLLNFQEAGSYKTYKGGFGRFPRPFVIGGILLLVLVVRTVLSFTVQF